MQSVQGASQDEIVMSKPTSSTKTMLGIVSVSFLATNTGSILSLITLGYSVSPYVTALLPVSIFSFILCLSFGTSSIIYARIRRHHHYIAAHEDAEPELSQTREQPWHRVEDWTEIIILALLTTASGWLEIIATNWLDLKVYSGTQVSSRAGLPPQDY